MTVTARRSNNRNQDILDGAAKVFAERGFGESSMREIAKASGMLPGSIYYHYSSKEDLLLSVYEAGVKIFCDRFDKVVEQDLEPWELLERVIANHIRSITADDHYSKIINRVLPEHLPNHAHTLRALRDQYDGRIKFLISRLKLSDSTDPKMLRLFLLGASNWAQFWFKPGENTAEDVAKAFVTMVRAPIGKELE